MIWGNFTTTHFVTLLVAMLLIYALFRLAVVLKEPCRKWVLLFFSCFGYGAILYNLLRWGTPLEYLPLELCSFNAMILPIVVLTKNKVLGNCLALWALGALMALLLNNGVANFDVFTWTFFWYYFPHVLEFGLPFLLIKFGYIELKAKYVVSTVIITMLCYTGAHLANVYLNAYFEANDIRDYLGNVVTVNYMFSMFQTNPVLELFYSIIPASYWYMYLVVPIFAIYLTPLYYFSFRSKKKKGHRSPAIWLPALDREQSRLSPL